MEAGSILEPPGTTGHQEQREHLEKRDKIRDQDQSKGNTE